MRVATTLPLLLAPGLASAGSAQTLDLTGHPVGTAALVIFTVAYLAVVAEEFTKLRKSKPAILAAGLIWALIGAVYTTHGISDTAAAALRHNLLEYAELLLFLLAHSTRFDHRFQRHSSAASRVIRPGFPRSCDRGSRSAATPGLHCYAAVVGSVNGRARRLRNDSPLRVRR